ncbi:TIGR03619 family F420-dependent LLM class oxidoreductase [Sphingomonas naphthae]|uniref:TIGR03619 family F420-dependent LLM class oxidoreductase n=1 Tax=Sphingomonas naphthae TaxID=1813468 RepID=A0ABY7TII7_9SPHN|nr:TIGR03619 family F420-dependent LLM class oxidoreductase [Sphingomonas naphthae]WCT73036.1 TIGR03619 family F420-dependent LLM class oxidoreductase [Sphingomonas naphthae]
MKFGVPLPIGHISPPGEFQSMAAVRELAQGVEALGIDGVSTSEHPIPDAEWLRSDPTGHDCVDPFTALAFVAAMTSRLKVYTNVLVLPYRNPFLTAKAASTLAVLSDNRLMLGVGIGYQKAEFEALGVPFKERGPLTDEALETIRQVWAGGPIVKQGRYFHATGNEARPVPSPTPPIWIGGGSDAAIVRAARLGDGWIPHFSVPTNDPIIMKASVVSMRHFAEKTARLRELREEYGQTGPFDIAPRPPVTPKALDRAEADQFLEAVHQLHEAGANWVWTPLPAPSRAGFLENAAWYAEEVIARFRA